MSSQTDPIIEFVPVDQLVFDPKNPRLPNDVDGMRESDVLEWMLEEGQGNLPELMASIATQQFFTSEPLLIAPNGKKKDSFIVVEGNRRLAAVKLLLEPSKASKLKKTVTAISESVENHEDLRRVPVLKYARREDVLKYLGYRHVTGIKTWGALAKAKYLADLYGSAMYSDFDEEQRLREIARNIGSRANSVAKSLAGLRVYQHAQEQGFYQIPDMEEGKINFSLLTTALSYQNIYEFVGLKSPTDLEQKNIKDTNLRKLMSWVFQKNSEGYARVTESRKLRDLNDVIGNREALEQFDKRGVSLDDAVLYTGLPLTRYREAFVSARRYLKSAHDVLPFIRDGLDESDQNEVEDVSNQLKAIRAQIKSKLEDSTTEV